MPGRCSYRYFAAGMRWPASPGTVVACEPLSNHEDEGIHVLYGDGTIRWIKRDEATQVWAELRAGQNRPHPATQP